ncbi:MAG: hypothetical protein ACR2O4_06290, partial [Hyphomicrobiaceae bacterium]
VHAMSLDETATLDVTGRIIAFLSAQGDHQRAAAYAAKAEAWQASNDEPGDAFVTDALDGKLVAAPMTDGMASDLLRILTRVGASSAWLVQTPLRPWSADVRTHLIVEQSDGIRFAQSHRRMVQEMVRALPYRRLEMHDLAALSSSVQNALRQLEDAQIRATPVKMPQLVQKRRTTL